MFYAAVPRGGIYLLLLLQALASAAAVVWAQPLRPPSIAANDWQHLVSLLACSAMVSSLLPKRACAFHLAGLHLMYL